MGLGCILCGLLDGARENCSIPFKGCLLLAGTEWCHLHSALCVTFIYYPSYTFSRERGIPKLQQWAQSTQLYLIPELVPNFAQAISKIPSFQLRTCGTKSEIFVLKTLHLVSVLDSGLDLAKPLDCAWKEVWITCSDYFSAPIKWSMHVWCVVLCEFARNGASKDSSLVIQTPHHCSLC